ncbi:oligosaccharide flippase family protein [Herbiconiux sp. KACC 21604]|uniref:oligosaccharide flippase family protein n=1 Tax=unclassified Herbiconiux TaxID=2618217 RepID=UPI001490B697|nr:oligosaccharide flippase family protein [Herbiconiux sp. SALV-R1]QJU54582.1 oligosaccharide flippase family protein [Herbiconiux sp. SALV-R1]WPO85668.1 oligosaccharide flippase family protein [Herbiconiux sp. KACC 21604]
MKQQFLFILISRGLASVLNALAFVWLGRLVGVELVGVLGIVTSVTSFVFLIADFGMATFISRERARGNEDLVIGALRFNTTSTIAFGFLLTIALAVFALLGVVPYAVILLGLAAALEKNTETTLSVPIADKKKFVPAFNVLLRRALALVAFGAAVLVGIDAVLAFCFGTAAAALAGQIQIRSWMRGKVSHETPFTAGQLKDVAQRAWPFWISNVTAGARQLDIPIVGLFASAYSAGLYSASSKIMNPFRLIPSTLTSLVVPHVARQSSTTARRTALKLTALFMATLIVLIPASFLSETLVVFLMGPEFAGGGTIFALMLVGLPFVALAPPLGSVLQSQGQERFVGFNGTVFAVLTIVLVALGAIVAGGEGAAAGLAVSYLLKCVSLHVRILRVLK